MLKKASYYKQKAMEARTKSFELRLHEKLEKSAEQGALSTYILHPESISNRDTDLYMTEELKAALIEKGFGIHKVHENRIKDVYLISYFCED